MDKNNSFSKATFGGFKKDEVVSYIDGIVSNYDDELNELKKDNEMQKKQIRELKDIIEQQYQKIVITTEEAVDLKKQYDEQNEKYDIELKETIKKLDDKITENFQIQEQLKIASSELSELKENEEVLYQARETSKLMLEEARNEANETLLATQTQCDINISDSEKSAMQIKAKAEEEAKFILDNAKRDRDEMMSSTEIIYREAEISAQKSARDIISNAEQKAEFILSDASKTAEQIKSQAQNEASELQRVSQEQMANAKSEYENQLDKVKQIEYDTALSMQKLIEESQNKATEIIQEASAQSNEVMIKASKQAEETKRQAHIQFVEEREKYENIVKGIDAQKSSLLLAIDEIKNQVQSIKISKITTKMPECQSLSPSEILRKKLSMLNSK